LGEQEYKHAPVSEVILGITFKQKVIDVEALLDLHQLFKEDFSIIEFSNPLADVHLKGFKIVNEIEPDNTGPFRLRLRDSNSKWLLQIQLNKFYLNWIRKDTAEVGNYPGYEKIKKKFKEHLFEYLKRSDTPNREVDYYDLTYQDRLFWQDYIDSLGDINKIINLKPPKLETGEGFNNVNSRYTYHVPALNGYGILKVDSNTSVENKQVLKFEEILRGEEHFDNLGNWFNNAHQKQLTAFKNTFRKKILEKWR
jgi:uncharacterized protein (TIGR04255 family)